MAVRTRDPRLGRQRFSPDRRTGSRALLPMGGSVDASRPTPAPAALQVRVGVLGEWGCTRLSKKTSLELLDLRVVDVRRADDELAGELLGASGSKMRYFSGVPASTKDML